MRTIRNPFREMEGYFCFGCSEDNPAGLQMRFAEEGEEVTCLWQPQPRYQGFTNVLHGGIQATLMDELASWVVFVKLKTAGVTTRMETTYHRPVHTTAGELTLRGRVKGVEDGTAVISVELLDAGGRLCSSSEVAYRLYPPELARRRLHYPGFENFFEG